MSENFSHLNKKEQLKAENDFMKMKLMLERGAQFREVPDEGIPAELENEFLKNIVAYETLNDEAKKIKVFDKIGRPLHFKPVQEIKEDEMEKAWKDLRSYLNKHAIDLDVCSPNITVKELYRFTLEELFEEETDDMSMAGWVTCFIYDEFHPDPIYESERIVTDELLPGLFKTKPVDEYFHCLSDTDITLNGKLYVSDVDIKTVFNQFKSFFSRMDLQQTIIHQCKIIDATHVNVSGHFKTTAYAIDANKEIVFEGPFAIELRPDELGYWSVKKMQIGSIIF